MNQLNFAIVGCGRISDLHALGYLNNPNDPRSLSHNMVNTICEDKNGILWIGTAGGGINKYNPRKEKFLYYHHNPNKSESLSKNSLIRAIYND